MKYSHSDEWLQKLKVGDDVGLIRSGWGKITEIKKVERITNTMIIVDGTKLNV